MPNITPSSLVRYLAPTNASAMRRLFRGRARLRTVIGAIVMLLAVQSGPILHFSLAFSSAQNWDLNRINYVRSVHGVRPALYLGSNMTNRAQYWANHVAAYNLGAADDTGGAQTCWNAGGHYYGANSAYGFSSVNAAQYGLEGSPGHLANMLNSHFMWVGIGIATNSHGTVLIQDFCGK